MEPDFWNKRWENGEIQFHQNHVHPGLKVHDSRFVPAGKILVPLCGKSLDLIYLRDQGHQVMGIELSSLACEAFFNENAIPVTRTPLEDGVLYRSDRISIWCGDFFKAPPSVFSETNGIYDRAALVALPSAMRQEYVKRILDKTQAFSALDLLLFTFEYQDPEIKGPPFSIETKEVLEHFGPMMNVKEIFSDESGSFSKNHPRLHSKAITEKGYWISKK